MQRQQSAKKGILVSPKPTSSLSPYGCSVPRPDSATGKRNRASKQAVRLDAFWPKGGVVTLEPWISCCRNGHKTLCCSGKAQLNRNSDQSCYWSRYALPWCSTQRGTTPRAEASVREANCHVLRPREHGLRSWWNLGHSANLRDDKKSGNAFNIVSWTGEFFLHKKPATLVLFLARRRWSFGGTWDTLSWRLLEQHSPAPSLQGLLQRKNNQFIACFQRHFVQLVFVQCFKNLETVSLICLSLNWFYEKAAATRLSHSKKKVRRFLKDSHKNKSFFSVSFFLLLLLVFGPRFDSSGFAQVSNWCKTSNQTTLSCFMPTHRYPQI